MTVINSHQDTIVALATPAGVGAIGVIRVSGKEAIKIANKVFKGADLEKQKSHTIHFGTIRDDNEILDEVLVSLFIEPRSFTKENVVEISTHGSNFIIRKIIQLLLSKGARFAKPGEFTKRAFLNGKFDLAQAEAVADLIYADTEASHLAAMNQMRGGFSLEIKNLRNELVHFASMIELEVDFSEEDVEFASRDDLKKLVDHLIEVIDKLVKSFDLGNVIKNGVPTVIAGKPNVGKSTLLNALLKEDKAIVTDIPGTTRDLIEDEITLGGINFRFIDTAGLRDTEDTIEAIGVQRTREKMRQASLIIYLFDLNNETLKEIEETIKTLDNQEVPVIKVGNKIDLADQNFIVDLEKISSMVYISADRGDNLDHLKEKILEIVNLNQFKTGDPLVTSIRHFESLSQTKNSLDQVINGINSGISNDLLALDIRYALNHLGEITGEITTEDLLENIFSKFCIGK